jgi:hypothetical protein
MRDDDAHLPTPRGTLASSFVAVLVFCRSCRHQREADLQALVDGGRGDIPLVRLRWKCSRCRSERADFVCTSRDAVSVMPWRAPDPPLEAGAL